MMKNVSQTLFFTLCARGLDKNFHDPMAENILKENPDILVHKPGYMTKKLITTRASYFDNQIKRIHQHSNGQHKFALINLGGGLCSRFERLSEYLNNSVHLDLPEVIELLKKTFPHTAKHLIAEDLNSDSWPRKVASCLEHEETPVFTMEGVSMYLDKNALLKLFQMLPEFFPRGYLICDLLHPFFTDKAFLIRNVAQVNATFSSGIASTQEILHQSPQIKLDYVRSAYGFGGLPQILPFNLYQFATFSWNS